MKKTLEKIGLTVAIFAGLAGTASAAVCFPSQGCTGTATVPKSGQVLIGTSASIYAPAYLTAGANITITTSTGVITITGSAGSAAGTVTTSSAVTANFFPFWVTDGGLSGTSTLSRVGTTVNNSGTITVNGVAVITTSTISIGGVNSSTFNLGSNLFISSAGTIGVTSTPTFASSTNINSTLQVALEGRFGGAGGLYNYSVGTAVPSIGFNVDSGYLAGATGLGGLFQNTASTGELVYYTTDSVTAGNIFTFTRAMSIAPGSFSISSTNAYFQGNLSVKGDLKDFGGNKYSTSTVSTSTFSFGISFSSSTAAKSPPMRMPYSGTIFAWNMSAGASCSGSYDVWKAAGAIPTAANTIVGTDFPTLTSEAISSSVALTGWTKTFSKGDYFIVSATGTTTTCNEGVIQMDYSKN